MCPSSSMKRQHSITFPYRSQALLWPLVGYGGFSPAECGPLCAWWCAGAAAGRPHPGERQVLPRRALSSGLHAARSCLRLPAYVGSLINSGAGRWRGVLGDWSSPWQNHSGVCWSRCVDWAAYLCQCGFTLRLEWFLVPLIGSCSRCVQCKALSRWRHRFWHPFWTSGV